MLLCLLKKRWGQLGMEVWRARIDEDTACTALPGTSWGLGARDLLPALWAGSWGGFRIASYPLAMGNVLD